MINYNSCIDITFFYPVATTVYCLNESLVEILSTVLYDFNLFNFKKNMNFRSFAYWHYIRSVVIYYLFAFYLSQLKSLNALVHLVNLIFYKVYVIHVYHNSKKLLIMIKIPQVHTMSITGNKIPWYIEIHIENPIVTEM